jgi:1-acyl-sn-glycerol-3-phosphate acyltransferase
MSKSHPEGGLAKEIPLISESTRLFIVQIVAWVLEVLAKIEVTPQTLQNLEQLDQQLEESSVIAYAYHSSVFDALVLPIILTKHLENVDRLLAPIAITHYQGVQKIVLAIIAALTNTEFLPVIREKDAPHYDAIFKRNLLRHVLKTTREYLAEPNTIYGVAPMGTRSETLQSANIHPGFIKIAKKHKTPLVPISFTNNQQGRLQMSLGEILPPPTSNDLNQMVQFYMSQLALILPAELRGDYH